ncbi:TIGR02147 family protein [Bacteriovorax sp. PP10]|uniref:TIGR02147 family protein n=1 Tax=Bacteriovorax antarcticus TaxID=3088717 RepID=A0ABU5VNV0_9BACT|nr:TIGR02147 family protein [Bacteriovorax sp. PP10]MEA9354709.1 TIGR02147 family protein [Bacteriovorax sp. PP10]
MIVFEQPEYRNYMKYRLDQRRGTRSELAEYLGCQSGYISQVLQGLSDFSLEQGMKITQFLQLSEEESHFFMLLLQLEKASTQMLKDYFKLQIVQIKKQRDEIKNRIKVKSHLKAEDYHQYYSSWEYAALHILVSIPEFQQKEKIRKKLKLTNARLNEVLDFLLDKGLVEFKDDKYVIGSWRIHLPKDSPYILSHHQNWRLHTIRMLSDKNPLNLNYSGVFSLANADIQAIKEILLQSIEKTEKVIAPSPEEEMVYVGIDLNVF